jgi:hypothetical protein
MHSDFKLVRARLDNIAIAEELNRRGIPCLRADHTWTADKVQYLRTRLGIRFERGQASPAPPITYSTQEAA